MRLCANEYDRTESGYDWNDSWSNILEQMKSE